MIKVEIMMGSRWCFVHPASKRGAVAWREEGGSSAVRHSVSTCNRVCTISTNTVVSST